MTYWRRYLRRVHIIYDQPIDFHSQLHLYKPPTKTLSTCIFRPQKHNITYIINPKNIIPFLHFFFYFLFLFFNLRIQSKSPIEIRNNRLKLSFMAVNDHPRGIHNTTHLNQMYETNLHSIFNQVPKSIWLPSKFKGYI